MNRLEKELKVLEALGLEEGDIIRLSSNNKIYTIKRDILDRSLLLHNEEMLSRSISALITFDWEKVKPLGKKRCVSFDSCSNCPLNYINCRLFSPSDTLFKNIEYFKKLDPELHEFLCKRLEKEA